MAMHFAPFNPTHLRVYLANINGNVSVGVDSKAADLLPTRVATVDDLKALSAWPKELAVTIHSWDPPAITIRRL
jgi:hypothetical protein